ncbi:hypothetical protein FRC06_008395, partial [Ceratobasidium sp. 370]
MSLQAHAAPLDLVFYDRSKCALASNPGGLSQVWDGDAFASFHGSWNRDPPTGYAVVRIPFAKDGSGPIAKPNSKNGYETLVSVPDTTKCPDQCIRPVGIVFDQSGRMIVSSDDTGE